LERLRFVTNYPGDFTDDVFEAMRDLPGVCEYLHLPVQSGSDAVLERMRRRYTVARFDELVQRAYERVPGITLASDFVVGFCGETEEEFAETVALVERSRFKNVFVFKYSERPGTAADKRMADDVPDQVKRRRNGELLAVQERISLELNRRLIGRTVEVLVEGYSKAALKAREAEQSHGGEVGWRRSDQFVGRTRGDQIVVFSGGPQLIGRLTAIRITGATALTLFGQP
jgi:tRNA-2-methylthio-N6-dimethylallyladenosine synthase